jgi:hypothetical protein
LPSEEGRQVLQLLAAGKIDVDQAYRLLRALGDVDEAPRSAERRGARDAFPSGEGLWPADRPVPPSLRGHVLRVQVISGGTTKVNIAIPLAIARVGKAKLAQSGLIRSHLAKFGIELDEVLRSVERPGPIVDLSDEEDRVIVAVE